ncbi:hypothetical protein K1T71_012507 [Dendrolimus kikuchii]|uniref:Uncharacterized protein n=1 Tax=Dendrolimus kikuchii TaxID=765133 RepID=A0ACC1CJX6_9NEOP|nr:hypothetical protein K1T71_012507 [Dendrolimus kikuchii]
MYFKVSILLLATSKCFGQENQDTSVFRNSLTDKIGNFSIELLYHTAVHENRQNLIMSPFTVWTTLAVISEGATGATRMQINHAIRIFYKNRERDRSFYKSIAQWLVVKTNTINLAKANIMAINSANNPNQDYQEIAKTNYDVDVWPMDFSSNSVAAENFNGYIKNVTRGLITNAVDSTSFVDTPMVLASVLYFKAQWTAPFNASSTTVMPFYDENNQKIGEVNMMYNRYTYGFANMKHLKARVLELKYGIEDRLSMIIMVPHFGVSLEDMFRNFLTVQLDSFFEELRVSKEEYSEEEVDCFLPRFKIDSNIDLSEILKERMGIVDMFDPRKALLGHIARSSVYVSKIVHKAVIEVTEEGTSAAAVSVAEFTNRMGVVRFEANKPFAYIIVEKNTNAIVFGGVYIQPSLH